MPGSPSLFELQNRFKKLVTQEARPAPDELTEIRSSTGARKETRLEIYRYAYFARIIESLRDDFRRLNETLGESRFRSLIRRYLERFPSRYPNLAQVGRDLPGFLAEQTKFPDQPWLSELAELEWQCCLCRWSEDAEVRNFSELQQLPEDDQMRQILLLAPSARFFRAKHPVHRENRSSVQAVSLVLHRSRDEIRTLELTAPQEELLLAIQNKEPLGRIVDRIESDSELDIRWISEWVATGLIVGFQPA